MSFSERRTFVDVCFFARARDLEAEDYTSIRPEGCSSLIYRYISTQSCACVCIYTYSQPRESSASVGKLARTFSILHRLEDQKSVIVLCATAYIPPHDTYIACLCMCVCVCMYYVWEKFLYIHPSYSSRERSISESRKSDVSRHIIIYISFSLSLAELYTSFVSLPLPEM